MASIEQMIADMVATIKVRDKEGVERPWEPTEAQLGMLRRQLLLTGGVWIKIEDDGRDVPYKADAYFKPNDKE